MPNSSTTTNQIETMQTSVKDEFSNNHHTASTSNYTAADYSLQNLDNYYTKTEDVVSTKSSSSSVVAGAAASAEEQQQQHYTQQQQNITSSSISSTTTSAAHHDSGASTSAMNPHYADYPSYYNSKYPYYSQQYSYTAGTGDHLNLNVNLNVNLLPNQQNAPPVAAVPPVPPSSASAASVNAHQYYHYQNQCHQPPQGYRHQNGVNYTPPHSPESIAGV